MERGLRQHWLYEVKFEGGAVEEFSIPSKGLPLCVDRDNYVSKVRRGFKRQAFKNEFFTGIVEKKSNVMKILQLRGSLGNNIDSWNRIFNEVFPQSPEDPRFNNDLNYNNGLNELFLKYFGDVQVRYLYVFIFSFSFFCYYADSEAHYNGRM
jgi:hypothetical protein